MKKQTKQTKMPTAEMASGNMRWVAAMDDMLYGSGGENIQSGESGQDGKEDTTVIQEMITTLQSVKVGGQGMERRACMTQLIRMARSGTTGGLTEHFRTVLRVLLEN